MSKPPKEASQEISECVRLHFDDACKLQDTLERALRDCDQLRAEVAALKAERDQLNRMLSDNEIDLEMYDFARSQLLAQNVVLRKALEDISNDNHLVAGVPMITLARQTARAALESVK